MSTVHLAEAKAHLSELVGVAAAGGTVRILRHGKPVAQLTSAKSPRKPIDPAALRAVTDPMTVGNDRAAKFVRKMRDDEWY